MTIPLSTKLRSCPTSPPCFQSMNTLIRSISICPIIRRFCQPPWALCPLTASSIPFPLTICCHRTNEPVCAHCTAAPPPMCSEDRIYPQSSWRFLPPTATLRAVSWSISTSPELSRRSWYANTVYPAVNSYPCSTVRARVSGEREHCPHPVRVLSSSIRRSWQSSSAKIQDSSISLKLLLRPSSSQASISIIYCLSPLCFWLHLPLSCMHFFACSVRSEGFFRLLSHRSRPRLENLKPLTITLGVWK